MAMKLYRVWAGINTFYPEYLYKGSYRKFENGWDQHVEFKTRKEAIDFLNAHIDKVIAQQTEVIKQARDKIREQRAARPR